MKLLKLKMFLHEGTMLFSIGLTMIMLVEARNALYPKVFCYICAVVSLVNVLYSAWLLVDCNMEIEEAEARERR